MQFVSGLVKNSSTYLLTLTGLVLFTGCYAFVGDEAPPEWKDPEGSASDIAAIAAGTGGPGASVYNAKCAVCHQMNGQGIPKVYPNLVGSSLVVGDPALPIRIVLHGFNGPIERDGISYNGVMQPWKNDLSDQEIADVVNYVRTNWGNDASEITAEDVKAQREATRAKVGAYTEAELKSSL
ncbi:MAG: cytochrome c [Bacteroidetes bacterium]|nr:cytochrome c [Bacteroidota bacterium]